ncbi:MAG: hypothetical protein KAJ19_14520, partial [Gammaproteobacteria bacterium]|nr:hypothetical protein [Gammaproteobacteria bacterium]
GNIPNSQFARCGPYDALWTKIKTPEPVYYLDIPEKYQRWINPELMKRQGESCKIWDDALFELGWIKQKPQQPTREELQIRLDSICEYVKNENGVSIGSSNIIYDLANREK